MVQIEDICVLSIYKASAQYVLSIYKIMSMPRDALTLTTFCDFPR